MHVEDSVDIVLRALFSVSVDYVCSLHRVI
jgi:hypothetical protein